MSLNKVIVFSLVAIVGGAGYLYWPNLKTRLHFITPEPEAKVAAPTAAVAANPGSPKPAWIKAAPCAGLSEDRSLRFQGELRLDQRFLPPGAPSQIVLHDAVEEQLKFLPSEMSYGTPSSTAEFFPSLASEEISDLTAAEGKYGVSATVDHVPDLARSGGAGTYVQGALAATKTDAGDPAWIVHYKVHIQTAICWKGASAEPLPELHLPSDPYLAYWFVAPTDRRPIQMEQTKGTINPCAIPSLVELKFPTFYSYTWNSSAKGRDASGRDFDCSTLLHPDQQVLGFKAELEPASTSSLSRPWGLAPLLDLDRPLHATVILGTLQPFKKLPNMNEWIKSDLDGHGHVLLRFNKSDRSMHKPPHGGDRSAFKFIKLLGELERIFVADQINSHDEAGDLIVELKGTLRESHKPIELRMFFGVTAEDAPGGGHHWKELARALAEDDLVFYAGHAGMGRNMSLAGLQNAMGWSPEQLERAVAKMPYQFLGITSCRTANYFGRDWMALREKGQNKSDLYLHSVPTFNEVLPISVLEMVDTSLTRAKKQMASRSPLREGSDRLLYLSF